MHPICLIKFHNQNSRIQSMGQSSNNSTSFKLSNYILNFKKQCQNVPWLDEIEIGGTIRAWVKFMNSPSLSKWNLWICASNYVRKWLVVWIFVLLRDWNKVQEWWCVFEWEKRTELTFWTLLGIYGDRGMVSAIVVYPVKDLLFLNYEQQSPCITWRSPFGSHF